MRSNNQDGGLPFAADETKFSRTCRSSGSDTVHLRTTDRYSHTDKELEYRREAAKNAGLCFVVGPNGPKTEVVNFSATV